MTRTFADEYNHVEGICAPTFRQERRKLIALEFEKYKSNMDLRSARNARPNKLKIAMTISITSVLLFVAYRFFQGLYLYDSFSGVYGMLMAFVISCTFVISYIWYVDPSTFPRKSNHMPLVSVVIATKNERSLIYDTVDGVLTQSYKNLNVIIVNDGSDDDGATERAINNIVANDPDKVRAIHSIKNMGKRKAMHIGFNAITDKTELVIFLDSDTIIEHEAISKLVTCMVNQEDLGAVVGYCRSLNNNRALNKMQDSWYHSAFTLGKGMEDVLGTVTCCSGILSAYRVEAIKECMDDWSNDRFMGVDFQAGDDRQLTAFAFGGTRALINPEAKRWKTRYCESAISISETPSTYKKFVNQQIRWAQSWVRCFIFTLPWFWKGRHPVSTIYYYAMMFLSIFAPIIAVRNLIILPLLDHSWESAVIYTLGLLFLSILFAIDFIVFNPKVKRRALWRILFTFLSVFLLYGLLYYAVLTIRKNDWLTR